MVSVVPMLLSVISTVESVLEACKKTKWSRRSNMLVEQIEALLKMITVSENRIFDDFSANIVGRIDDCLASLKKLNKPSSIANISKAVEKLSTSFHEERIGAH